MGRIGFNKSMTCVLSLLLLCAAGAARAEYPERPVTLVVNFAAGGGVDVAARMIAIPLAVALGKAVVVENRIGAGGTIGISAVGRAPADGYTLLVSSSAFVVNPSLSRKQTYDPAADFSPIATIGVSPNIIAVRRNSDLKSLADLIAAAKAKPGTLNYASPGLGTTPHLAAELIKQRAGIDMVHVPYAGGGPATQSVVAGTTEVLSANLSNIMGFLGDGTLRALVQTAPTRWPDLPQVPLLAEAGLPNAETDLFIGVWAPANTPRPIVERLSREILTITGQADTAQRLRKMGVDPTAEGPETLAKRVQREVPLYRQVIEAAGVATN